VNNLFMDRPSLSRRALVLISRDYCKEISNSINKCSLPDDLIQRNDKSPEGHLRLLNNDSNRRADIHFTHMGCGLYLGSHQRIRSDAPTKLVLEARLRCSCISSNRVRKFHLHLLILMHNSNTSQYPVSVMIPVSLFADRRTTLVKAMCRERR